MPFGKKKPSPFDDLDFKPLDRLTTSFKGQRAAGVWFNASETHFRFAKHWLKEYTKAFQKAEANTKPLNEGEKKALVLGKLITQALVDARTDCPTDKASGIGDLYDVAGFWNGMNFIYSQLGKSAFDLIRSPKQLSSDLTKASVDTLNKKDILASFRRITITSDHAKWLMNPKDEGYSEGNDTKNAGSFIISLNNLTAKIKSPNFDRLDENTQQQFLEEAQSICDDIFTAKKEKVSKRFEESPFSRIKALDEAIGDAQNELPPVEREKQDLPYKGQKGLF